MSNHSAVLVCVCFFVDLKSLVTNIYRLPDKDLKWTCQVLEDASAPSFGIGPTISSAQPYAVLLRYLGRNGQVKTRHFWPTFPP